MPGGARSGGLTIACCADSAAPTLRSIARLIRGQDPDLVLFVGDARARGTGIRRVRAWRWRSAWGGIATRVITVPGNHDYGRGGEQPWRWHGGVASARRTLRVSPTGAFVLRRDDVQIVGVDCGPDAARVPADQVEWIRDELAADATTPHRIALCHAPPFPVSEHIGSSLDADPAARDAFWECLEDCRVNLLVCGHEHLYARRMIRRRADITQVITGGAGAQGSPLLAADVQAASVGPHAVVLRVLPTSIEGVAMDPDGRILDRFTVLASVPSAP